MKKLKAQPGAGVDVSKVGAVGFERNLRGFKIVIRGRPVPERLANHDESTASCEGAQRPKRSLVDTHSSAIPAVNGVGSNAGLGGSCGRWSILLRQLQTHHERLKAWVVTHGIEHGRNANVRHILISLLVRLFQLVERKVGFSGAEIVLRPYPWLAEPRPRVGHAAHGASVVTFLHAFRQQGEHRGIAAGADRALMRRQ